MFLLRLCAVTNTPRLHDRARVELVVDHTSDHSVGRSRRDVCDSERLGQFFESDFGCPPVVVAVEDLTLAVGSGRDERTGSHWPTLVKVKVRELKRVLPFPNVLRKDREVNLGVLLEVEVEEPSVWLVVVDAEVALVNDLDIFDPLLDVSGKHHVGVSHQQLDGELDVLSGERHSV